MQALGVSQQKKAAQGQLELARGQYLGAAQLGYTELRSPIDGVIANRAVYPGDIAPAGTPLLVVMDTSKVVVRLHVPREQVVEVGDAATLQVQGVEAGVPAKVTVISPALDPNSTTVEIWIEADNPGDKLKPGAAVGVSIRARTVTDALVVPASALLAGLNGETRVMVVGEDSRAYSRTVTTGIQQGPLVRILTVAWMEILRSWFAGAYGLPDKTKVNPKPADVGDGGQA